MSLRGKFSPSDSKSFHDMLDDRIEAIGAEIVHLSQCTLQQLRMGTHLLQPYGGIQVVEITAEAKGPEAATYCSIPLRSPDVSLYTEAAIPHLTIEESAQLTYAVQILPRLQCAHEANPLGALCLGNVDSP